MTVYVCGGRRRLADLARPDDRDLGHLQRPGRPHLSVPGAGDRQRRQPGAAPVGRLGAQRRFPGRPRRAADRARRPPIDLGAPAQPGTQPSTNPLFTQAQQAIPAPVQANRPSRSSRRSSSRSAVGPSPPASRQSEADIGPMAIVVFPDGSALVSGGPDRNELFSFTVAGGQATTPLATEPFPIYDMALDAAGNLWATTGGGPLLELDPQTGAILGQYGDSLTQSLAIQPGTGLDLRLLGRRHRDLQPHDPDLQPLQRPARRQPGLRAGRLALGRRLAPGPGRRRRVRRRTPPTPTRSPRSTIRS